MMTELSARQKLILTLVIHEYIRTAAPVGSPHLVKEYHLDLSPATVRNELKVLKDMGYLREPHTSAGPVPTEEGYRYFVERLLQQTELPDTTRRTISHQFYQMRHDSEQWMRLAASVLANQSRAVSMVTTLRPNQALLKHVELIATRGRQVLMVLVMVGGDIRQRILSLDESVSQEQLSLAADRINQLMQNRGADSVRALRSQLDPLDQVVADWISTEMSSIESMAAGEIYLDGITNVLAEPEFADSEEALRALHLLEERTLLREFLARTVLNGGVGAVQVLIGGEGAYDELRQYSVVLARYGAPGLSTGTLGVLGPMRMPYGRTISMVRFLAGLLSDLVAETLVE
jgi:heat-inducible transcriptional repressor